MKTKRQLDREIDTFLQEDGRGPRRGHLDRPHHAHDGSWRGSRIQSLLFERPRWSADSAKAWATDHGYRSGKVHATEHYLRLRQLDPVRGAQKRTITFGEGIRAVIEQVN